MTNVCDGGRFEGYSDPSDLGATRVALGDDAMRDSYAGADSPYGNMRCKHNAISYRHLLDVAAVAYGARLGRWDRFPVCDYYTVA